MKVGMIRHFKVMKNEPKSFKCLKQSGLIKWFDEYDAADVEKSDIYLGGIDWNVCYTSNLLRAKKTTESIFKGPAMEKEEIRELKLHPVFKRDVKLPFFIWPYIIRFAWYFNHRSQRKHKIEFSARIKAFVDDILNMDMGNVLVVSHAALMYYLRKELMKRGFKGPRFKKPENGLLYVYEI